MNIKISSLSKSEDFKKIMNGKKIVNKYSIIFFNKISLNKNNQMKNKNNQMNVSFVTKKKLGNAVIRNKIKRRLKNILTDALKKININLNYSYLFIAKKNVFDDDFNLIKEYIFRDLKKIK